MASPFVGVPVDLGALIVQASLWRDRTDPLALSDDILYERYRFSSEGIRYLIVLVGPYVGNAMLHKEAVHLLLRSVSVFQVQRWPHVQRTLTLDNQVPCCPLSLT